ncbi:secondary thiamine-phosphate synthase enzyme YjbQ [Aquabacter cavernae]|uniref:secondary thiamine-phosphate synthase enzyme YjbQ n=1 Tax=Aquabacter cavernae TaxID=2496029 RepID=UPI000F8DD209|nr:secondary thiamine-phosphate synthase enzyme YjbQ [Aquabacter cavernae]
MTRTHARTARIDFHAEARLTVRTPGEGFTDLTREVRAFLTEIKAGEGMAYLFCRHTSASLTIQENADPDVRTDLITALRLLAPRDHPWVHDLEGPDDMPAHIRTLLSDTQLAIPVSQGRPLLGTWQAVYLVEHRARPHEREVVLAFSGAATT